MKRKAILLAEVPKESSSSGVFEDLDAFQAFLQTDAGGAWESEQIVVGKNLPRNQILSLVKNASDADYSLVYFAGKGESVKLDLPWKETQMFLNSGETITERDLNSGSPSCLLIMDCSHGTSSKGKASPLIDARKHFQQAKNKQLFQREYEKIISLAEKGLIKIFSTPIDVTRPTKCSFTQLLLNESKNWAETHQNGVLFLSDVVKLAERNIDQEAVNLKSQYLGGRRLHDFPFMVKG